MQPVTVSLGDRITARALFDPICQLYDEIFSVPPFHWNPDESEQHRRRFKVAIASLGFGITTAVTDDELVGFAYGYQLPVSTRWWEGFLEPVPAELTTEYEGRTFAVIDLAVRQGWAAAWASGGVCWGRCWRANLANAPARRVGSTLRV